MHAHARVMFYSATTSTGEKKVSTKIPLCVELAKNKNPVNMSDCMKEGRIM